MSDIEHIRIMAIDRTRREVYIAGSLGIEVVSFDSIATDERCGPLEVGQHIADALGQCWGTPYVRTDASTF